MLRGVALVSAAAVGMLVLAGCSSASVPLTSATVADAPTAVGVSDGDLWPSCWSDDDALYAANGDGAGFGSETSDIVMNRITGSPASDDLTGEALAVGDALGEVWTETDAGDAPFTRKPTGMLCIDGTLYLAVQDLSPDFNAAPNATIARSDDHGKTWAWDETAPMFTDGVFATVWFADYGKDAERRPDERYVYAYGLDGNWRDSFTDAVTDPTELFLARVPVDSVQDASTWEFFAGADGEAVIWADIAEKKPVLTDDRLTGYGMTVLSQGGVTYLPKHDRYLYTSWTEYTFEFYEAPQPWGPWRLFHSDDFGAYPWTEDRIGGYAATVPSKFVSTDEKTLWLQTNVCPCAPAGVSSYWFGLREMMLDE